MRNVSGQRHVIPDKSLNRENINKVTNNMVKRCVWGTCNSDDRYKDKPHMSGVEFFPIPKPKTRMQETLQWVKACGRKNYTVANVNKHAYVCSKHFIDGRPTAMHPYPTIATLSNQVVHKSRKLPFDRAMTKTIMTTPTKTQTEVWMDVQAYVTVDNNTPTDQPLQATAHSCEELKGDHSYTKPVEQKVKIQTNSVSVQTEISFDDMSPYSDGCFKDRGEFKRQFIMDDIFKSDKTCKFYTGLSLAMFTWLFSFLQDKARNMVYWNSVNTNERESSETLKPGPKRMLTIKEELAITLIRLRRGFDTKSLGNMFGMSESSVSRIFNTWINLVSHELNFLIRWPSMEQIRNKLPKCFKYFPKTRCIIDCTEFFTQRPSLPSAQRITYSQYKHHNTFKCLVGITPSGTFSFVSDLFTGSISDKKIVQDSGFLDNIQFGDDIMADRGFLIRGN
ncbi:unnamed protein product [Mytilus edulis]|uniref:THAP-type domain-containing protein n=1 Tax=Mytilus edulis TaxID=6550 RepID=A0A8S3T0G1_MYTED|nr:unnamed protein product [Mytilus edulis]